MPDPLCPPELHQPVNCPVCAVLEQARGQERAAFSRTWKENLPLITREHYERGHKAAQAGEPLY